MKEDNKQKMEMHWLLLICSAKIESKKITNQIYQRNDSQHEAKIETRLSGGCSLCERVFFISLTKNYNI